MGKDPIHNSKNNSKKEHNAYVKEHQNSWMDINVMCCPVYLFSHRILSVFRAGLWSSCLLLSPQF